MTEFTNGRVPPKTITSIEVDVAIDVQTAIDDVTLCVHVTMAIAALRTCWVGSCWGHSVAGRAV